MVPPDGARTKRIPALSWDSVVDTDGQPAQAVDRTPDDVPGQVGDVIMLAPLSLDLSAPNNSDESVDDVLVEPLHLDAPRASAAPAPAPATALTPAPSPTPAPAAGTNSAPTGDEPPAIRTTPPAVIVPAIGDVISGPDAISVSAETGASATESATDALPDIKEATPAESPSPSPSLPSIPAPVPRSATPTSFEFDPASVVSAPTQQPRRTKKRSGVKLLATFLVLGGLVAGGVVFGQAYLFPGEWDDATAPYAEAVESASGVPFAEPLSIVAEATADFATRLQVQFASVSPEELAQWRALGLASGTVDDATLAQQLTGWQDAVYSTLDGQVYRDLGAAGPELDAQLVQEMAAVSLDQQFGWSVDQPERTLDAAAATSAEVLRQARAVQQASDFAAVVAPVPTELVDTMPPVIGYRMLAPQVFAEFDAAIETTDGTNLLADLGTGGPGILGRDTSTLATGPAMLDGDVVIASPVAKDRSFWFLAFAGYLDSRTAFEASEAVVENSLTPVARGTTQCVAATFSGSGVEQTATLRSALTAWVAAAPAEMASSFQVLPDGTLQLVSCDPGAGFDAAARPGVVRELLSWRMAVLATVEAVRFGGGGEPQFLEAWPVVAASPIALELTTLPPTATPPEMAGATREAFNALFQPAG